jgi:hypothetical protein
MPAAAAGAVIGAAVSTGAGVITGTVVAGAIATTFMTSLAVNLVLGGVSQLLQKKPEQPSFASQSSDRTLSVRQPITTRTTVYGRVKVGGPILFIHTTDSNNWFHMIVGLASHEIEAIDDVYFDDEKIGLDGINGTGKYQDKAYVTKHLGSPGQAADAGLLADCPDVWTSNDKLSGIAHLYIKLKFDNDVFPNGIPNIAAIIRGKKVYDPRSSTTVYSTNPALCIRDYLSDAKLGMSFTSAEFDDASFIAAANICDETVAVQASPSNAINGVPAMTSDTTPSGVVSSSSQNDLIRRRYYAFDGSDTTYWAGGGNTGWLQYKFASSQTVVAYSLTSAFKDAPTDCASAWQLLASNTGAFSGEQVTLDTQTAQYFENSQRKDYTLANTTPYLYYRLNMTNNHGGGAISMGDIQLKISPATETRYTCNGTVDSAGVPQEIISSMLSAMAGKLVFAGGLWRLFSGAYITPTVTLDESHCRGPIQVSSRISRRELFNAVKGVYVSEFNNWQPSDFPPVTNSAYLAEDNNERVWKDINLPFTTSSSMAQRLAKIELERARRQITVSMPLNLAGLQITAGDTVYINNTRFGWTNKAFEIQEWALAIEQDETGAPLPGVNCVFREVDSNIYSWTTAEETISTAAPRTNLPNPFVVASITGLTLQSGTDTLYTPASGGGGVISRILAKWNQSTDSYVRNGGNILVEYRKAGDSQWQFSSLERGDATQAYISNVTDGIYYEVRVKPVNSLGVSGDYTQANAHYVTGKLAPPSDVTGFLVSQNGSSMSFQWNPISDADLSYYEIRYSPRSNAYGWSYGIPLTRATKSTNTVSLTAVPGDWVFYLKAVDTSGNYSTTEARFAQQITSTYTDILTKSNVTDKWTGVLSNMLLHPSNVLVPLSQGLASDDDWDTFDTCVPNPYEDCYYTPAELDVGYDISARVWGRVEAYLAPGAAGLANPKFQLKHRLSTQPSSIITQSYQSISSGGGTFYNMVWHPSGALVPTSKGVAADDGWDTFDKFVPNPESECYYIAPEIDFQTDVSGTFTGSVTCQLGPGETSGVANANYQVDYRKAADSYDGYEAWGAQMITARYVKQKVTIYPGNGIAYIPAWTASIDPYADWIMGDVTGRYYNGRLHVDTSEGVAIITAYKMTVDKSDVIQSAKNVSIAAGGTVITFPNRYYSTPDIKYAVVSTGALFAVISSKSATGFTAKIYNNSGTDVGGTLDWEARGV